MNSLISFGIQGSPPPPGNNVPLGVQADWEDAFAVISVGNPTEGGIARVGGLADESIMQRRKAQAKAIMNQQMNGHDQAVHS